MDEVVSWELLSRDKSVKVRTTELLEMLPSFDANAHQALARLLKDKRAYRLPVSPPLHFANLAFNIGNQG